NVHSANSLGSVKVFAFATDRSSVHAYRSSLAPETSQYTVIQGFGFQVSVPSTPDTRPSTLSPRHSSLSSLISPIRIFRMFQIPQRAAAPHLGQGLEVVFRRRRRCGPLQGPGVPGIVAGRRPAAQRPKYVGHQAANTRDLKESPNRRDHIVDFPTAAGVIGINAPRHAEDPGYVLRVESEMKADEE